MKTLKMVILLGSFAALSGCSSFCGHHHGHGCSGKKSCCHKRCSKCGKKDCDGKTCKLKKKKS